MLEFSQNPRKDTLTLFQYHRNFKTIHIKLINDKKRDKLQINAIDKDGKSESVGWSPNYGLCSHSNLSSLKQHYSIYLYHNLEEMLLII